MNKNSSRNIICLTGPRMSYLSYSLFIFLCMGVVNDRNNLKYNGLQVLTVEIAKSMVKFQCHGVANFTPISKYLRIPQNDVK